jgi:hypothetical protein
MKIGLVVGEPCDSKELERRYGGKEVIEAVEFEDEDGTITRV